jgi:HD-GYP domain-containing protein (c-di-GMP phosphodiesterase class II)
MVVGHPIYSEDATVLIGEGTKLTNKLIFSLLERPIFSVYIHEPDAAAPETAAGSKEAEAGAPPKEYLLDEHYVCRYLDVFEELRVLFSRAAQTGEVDMEVIGNLAASGFLMELCDGAKAVTQIHNMVRDGDYLLHHSIHVAILAGLMGKWLRMPRSQRQKLIISGLVHDVGKLRISRDILDKAGRLTSTELKLVRRHAELGYEMLRYGQLQEENDILMGVLQHHERNDGSGYPQGCRAAEINPFARILAIADMYDAMAANRVYAKKKNPFEVFGVLSDDIMNKRLDTEYGVLFIRKICHALNGSWLKLSNGKRAKIVYIDDSRMSALPIVQTPDEEFIDLNHAQGLKIIALLNSRELHEEA